MMHVKYDSYVYVLVVLVVVCGDMPNENTDEYEVPEEYIPKGYLGYLIRKDRKHRQGQLFQAKLSDFGKSRRK